MSTPASIEAQLTQMERVEPQPPATEPVAAPEPVALNVEDEAAVDAVLETDAIETPDGGKLVDSAKAGQVGQAYRGKIRELKKQIDQLAEGSAKAQQLEAKVGQLEAALAQVMPLAQAYQQQALSQQPQAPKEPEVSDSEAEQYARTYDLYKNDGTGQVVPDLERGRKIVSDMRRIATEAADKAAEKHVAPIQAQSVQSQSSYMLQRAKNTVLPNGLTVDGPTLDSIAARIDPSVTATTEGTQWSMFVALGLKMAQATPEELQAMATQALARSRQRGPSGQFVAAAPVHVPDPVPREPAGGQPPQAPSTLSDRERAAIAQIGISEADYLKTAGTRFGGR